MNKEENGISQTCSICGFQIEAKKYIPFCSKCFKDNKKKETINDAIAHLNGYSALLENKFSTPTLAVNNTIKELRGLLR